MRQGICSALWVPCCAQGHAQMPRLLRARLQFLITMMKYNDS